MARTDYIASLTIWDAGGLVGVALMLVAYGLTVADRLEATGVPALSLNLAGATLVLLSLRQDFNLSAAVIEAAWALIALAGLARHAIRRARGG